MVQITSFDWLHLHEQTMKCLPCNNVRKSRVRGTPNHGASRDHNHNICFLLMVSGRPESGEVPLLAMGNLVHFR